MKAPSTVYDLSQPVFADCPQYPDANPRPAQIRLFYMQAVQGVNKEIVEISTHTGTHCDAPYHFFPDGKTIDEKSPSTHSTSAPAGTAAATSAVNTEVCDPAATRSVPTPTSRA